MSLIYVDYQISQSDNLIIKIIIVAQERMDYSIKQESYKGHGIPELVIGSSK